MLSQEHLESSEIGADPVWRGLVWALVCSWWAGERVEGGGCVIKYFEVHTVSTQPVLTNFTNYLFLGYSFDLFWYHIVRLLTSIEKKQHTFPRWQPIQVIIHIMLLYFIQL